MFKKIKKLIELFPTLSGIYRYSRHLIKRKSKAKITPWGFSLVGNDLMAEGRFEPIETEIVRSLIEEIDILVNIGANIGYYCCHALSLNKNVIAIEPNDENLYFLMKNCIENKWIDKVEIYPVALASKSSIMKMYGGGTGASLLKGWASISEAYSTFVPVLTLDRIIGQSLNGKRALVIADVEGLEYELLKGALNTLKNNPKPLWLIEITSTENQTDVGNFNPNFKKTFELFFQFGYRAFTSDKNQDEINIDIIDRLMKNKEKFGIHNFIFR